MFQLIPKKTLLLTTMQNDSIFFAKALKDANCETYFSNPQITLEVFSSSLEKILEKSYDKYYKIILFKDDPNLVHLKSLSTQIQII